MINWNETISLFTAYDQQEERIVWLRDLISHTYSPMAVDILTDDLRRTVKGQNQTRKILEQYYIHGITSEQIQKDIQP